MPATIPINPDVSNIPYGDRKRILDASRGKKGIVDLASGNPDRPMPTFIVERMKEALNPGYARYTDYYGLPELRQKLSRYLKLECGISADPKDELLITHGVQEGLYITMRCILHPGDEVLIPSPHYANYFMNTLACGARPVLICLDQEQGFLPDLERFRKAVTPRTRALVFCNPSNPLGVVWSKPVLEGLARFAIGHDLIVLVDEIYRDFCRAGKPVSIGSFPGMRDRTFTFGGFSKSFMMMGLRVGFVAGPAEVMFHIKNLHYCVSLCPSSLGQAAALAALDCPREELEPLYREFVDALGMIYGSVMTIPGVKCVPAEGGFFIFPDMRCFGMSSMDLAVRLVEEAGVLTLPGTEFGPYGEGHLRLSVCAKREALIEGINRLRRYAEGRGFVVRTSGDQQVSRPGKR
jgi:aminotransferase